MNRNQPSSILPAWVATIALAALAVTPFTQAQSIEAIESLPTAYGNHVTGVSGDGSVAVGIQWGNTEDRGFIYRPGGVQTDLGFAPGSSSTWAAAVSLDGSTVVGYAFEALTFRGFRYRNGTMELLPAATPANLRSFASGTSRDGHYVTGGAVFDDGGHAVRWTPTGVDDLGLLSGQFESMGSAISANGKVVGGVQFGSGPDVAFVWKEGVGSQALNPLHPDDYATVNALNAPGSIAVGASGIEATLWRNGSARGLGLQPGGTYSVAYTISADGRVAGGLSADANFVSSATVWNDTLGLVNLNEYLPTVGVDLADWHLDGVSALSADGSTLAGFGFYKGEYRGFVVRGLSFPAAVPEGSPTACAAALMALAAVVRQVRRR